MKQPYETPTLTRNGQLYSGVVIGGPLAGRMLTSATRSYTHAEAPTMPTVAEMEARAASAIGEIRHHNYRFTEAFFPDGSEVPAFPMWLHDSVPTLADAFKILGDSYVKAQRKK